ncbi:hypothetical protein QOT17_021964 [Balamuthia mandrillaris]
MLLFGEGGGRGSVAQPRFSCVEDYWKSLDVELRKALVSERKHVVLQALRKKHLHKENCPCCSHARLHFDGGAKHYELFCTALEERGDAPGLIDIHNFGPASSTTNPSSASSSTPSKQAHETNDQSKLSPSEDNKQKQQRPQENETEEHDDPPGNPKRDLVDVTPAQNETSSELKTSPTTEVDQSEDEDGMVDVPTIFGDCLCVKHKKICLNEELFQRNDLLDFLTSKVQLCEKFVHHYSNCDMCSSYHVFELFIFDMIKTNIVNGYEKEVKTAKANEMARQLLQEEAAHKPGKKKKNRTKSKKKGKKACPCPCHTASLSKPEQVNIAANTSKRSEESQSVSPQASIADENEISSSLGNESSSQKAPAVITNSNTHLLQDSNTNENTHSEGRLEWTTVESRKSKNRHSAKRTQSKPPECNACASTPPSSSSSSLPQLPTPSASSSYGTNARLLRIKRAANAHARSQTTTAPTLSLAHDTSFATEKHRKRDDGKPVCSSHVHHHHSHPHSHQQPAATINLVNSNSAVSSLKDNLPHHSAWKVVPSSSTSPTRSVSEQGSSSATEIERECGKNQVGCSSCGHDDHDNDRDGKVTGGSNAHMEKQLRQQQYLKQHIESLRKAEIERAAQVLIHAVQHAADNKEEMEWMKGLLRSISAAAKETFCCDCELEECTQDNNPTSASSNSFFSFHHMSSQQRPFCSLCPPSSPSPLWSGVSSSVTSGRCLLHHNAFSFPQVLDGCPTSAATSTFTAPSSSSSSSSSSS